MLTEDEHQVEINYGPQCKKELLDAFLASIIKADAEAADYFKQQDSQLFFKIRESVSFYTLFALEVYTKKSLRFLNCWYFCLLQFYWLLYHSLCAYYLGQ